MNRSPIKIFGLLFLAALALVLSLPAQAGGGKDNIGFKDELLLENIFRDQILNQERNQPPPAPAPAPVPHAPAEAAPAPPPQNAG